MRTYAENFQDVREKQPIVRLVDSSRIEMVVDVPETLISYARLVDDVEVTFDPFPDLVIPAKIKEIGSSIGDDPDLSGHPDHGSAGRRRHPAWHGGQGLAQGPSHPRLLRRASSCPIRRSSRCRTMQRPVSGCSIRRRGRPSPGDPDGNVTRFGLAVLDGVAPGEWVVTAGVHYLEEGQRSAFRKK